jgi:uncharacterized protein (UPF0261 family)
MMTEDQRREMARTMCAKLAEAKGPTVLLVPLQGGNEWDRPGGPLSDPSGLSAFVEELRSHCPANVALVELDAHINDPEFADAALKVFDVWVAEGAIGGATKP